MNVMSWNCRGTASKGFASLIRDICREYSTSLIFLLETHTSGHTIEHIVQKMGLDGCFVEEARGHAGFGACGT